MTYQMLRRFFRVTLLSLVRLVYRPRIQGSDSIPDEGGVLLTPNHISYIDTFILSASTKRPVRFLMDHAWYARPIIGRFARLFGAIPVSPDRAKDAIRTAAEALAAGDVVAIFPEGMLTNDGELCGIQGGYRLIAKKGGVPVVPVRMDGLWGSAFSKAPGRRWRKAIATVARGVDVTIDEALSFQEATQERIASFLESKK